MSLTEIQQKAAMLYATGKYTIVDIAKECSVHRTTIHRWLDDPEFQKEVERYENHIRKANMKKLESMVEKALEVLEKLLEHKKDYFKLQAAKEILDRAGYKPPEKNVLEVSPAEDTSFEVNIKVER